MRFEASDEAVHDEPRLLSDLEAKLVAHLLGLASTGNAALLASLDGARVREMDDGGQGSLRFEQPQPLRGFGRQIAEYRFADSDGVPVSATLNLDQLEDLYELDIFKGDFGRLLTIPTIDE
ncbi:hypothetical protein [Herbiconiux sp. VKM Ac-2851]|uniref:DUF6984 family protein n=1 Tax=Herbiconiux sp. VKM Ac-2851 TaxID=2739025 RepID=UPI001563E3FE|nr:hypothetical protein [Herbiconiux sp. VKM Ac-2851]NQX34479.1 hypothetical protein [Herbiconiux sp. VKM Ac-2851]